MYFLLMWCDVLYFIYVFFFLQFLPSTASSVFHIMAPTRLVMILFTIITQPVYWNHRAWVDVKVEMVYFQQQHALKLLVTMVSLFRWFFYIFPLSFTKNKKTSKILSYLHITHFWWLIAIINGYDIPTYCYLWQTLFVIFVMVIKGKKQFVCRRINKHMWNFKKSQF